MITVNHHGPVPPFEQIREQLGDLIRSGTLNSGHRLPSIRQLAGDLRLAAGTVARAYTELESAGLITTSRTAGTRVCAGHGFAEEVQHAADSFATAAQRNGLTLEEALGAVRTQWPLNSEPVDDVDGTQRPRTA
ncbi:GntR family transcriptional regulator [Arthrobacter sp. GMC3]|uniref:GntR family transcriptional regulator n=1 Tax=Arthrobacter sp. GMC3 TaxID=2058894 RepID=UPI000CE4CF44|nr:GntR family transcriptional regulator [Arthrobacter sp. GMC3]